MFLVNAFDKNRQPPPELVPLTTIEFEILLSLAAGEQGAAPPGLEHQIYSFHYIEYQSLPARTLVPVLVENPALPLQVAKMRSFRLSPKYILNNATIPTPW